MLKKFYIVFTNKYTQDVTKVYGWFLDNLVNLAIFLWKICLRFFQLVFQFSYFFFFRKLHFYNKMVSVNPRKEVLTRAPILNKCKPCNKFITPFWDGDSIYPLWYWQQTRRQLKLFFLNYSIWNLNLCWKFDEKEQWSVVRHLVLVHYVIFKYQYYVSEVALSLTFSFTRQILVIFIIFTSWK
jgi:hypothetical protein